MRPSCFVFVFGQFRQCWHQTIIILRYLTGALLIMVRTLYLSDLMQLPGRGAPLQPPIGPGARQHKPQAQNQKTVNESISLYLHRLGQHPCCQSSGFYCPYGLSRERARFDRTSYTATDNSLTKYQSSTVSNGKTAIAQSDKYR